MITAQEEEQHEWTEDEIHEVCTFNGNHQINEPTIRIPKALQLQYRPTV